MKSCRPALPRLPNQRMAMPSHPFASYNFLLPCILFIVAPCLCLL